MYNRATKYKMAIQVDLKFDHFCRLTEKGTHGIPDSVIPEPLLRNKRVSFFCFGSKQNNHTMKICIFCERLQLISMEQLVLKHPPP